MAGDHPDGAILGFSGTMWMIWATTEQEHRRRSSRRWRGYGRGDDDDDDDDYDDEDYEEDDDGDNGDSEDADDKQVEPEDEAHAWDHQTNRPPGRIKRKRRDPRRPLPPTTLRPGYDFEQDS